MAGKVGQCILSGWGQVVAGKQSSGDERQQWADNQRDKAKHDALHDHRVEYLAAAGSPAAQDGDGIGLSINQQMSDQADEVKHESDNQHGKDENGDRYHIYATCIACQNIRKVKSTRYRI